MSKGYPHLTRDQRCQLYTVKSSGKSANETVVKRHSKLTLLAQVSRTTAHEMVEVIKSKLGEVADCVLTIHADNGKEFANHEEITAKLGATVYFARPYHSWERVTLPR